MIKILFVCHGNICRSPMAEYIMKDLTKKKNICHKFEIASAATSTEEIGNPIYPPVSRLLTLHNIPHKEKRARQMTQRDYEYYDMIIAMDSNNLRNMSRFVKDDPKKKVSLLMDYTNTPKSVADPWYTGDFDTTWNDITAGCHGLLNYLKV